MLLARGEAGDHTTLMAGSIPKPGIRLAIEMSQHRVGTWFYETNPISAGGQPLIILIRAGDSSVFSTHSSTGALDRLAQWCGRSARLKPLQ